MFGNLYMYEVIKGFCENEAKNGLFLVDMPTGYGKTFQVIKYIYEASLKPENKNRHFIFVTTLRKNLPEKDLEKWFSDNNQSNLFKQKYLRIDSNMDCVLDNLLNIEKEVQDDIKTTPEFKDLIRDVKAIKNIERSKEAAALVSALRDNLRMDTEPKFRRFLQSRLDSLGSIPQKLDAIQNDKKWTWVPKLYPASLTSERQILFMSMDKFLSRNSPVVEASYMWYNNDKVIKDAFIFIDEFDATKETILSNIIENGLRDQVDYIELFLAIYSILHVKDFPKRLVKPSKKRSEGKYKDQSLLQLIKDIKADSDVIFKEYSLNFSHRTKNDPEQGQNFLFQDHQYHAILNGNKSFISVERNADEQINDICFLDEKPKNEKQSIQKLLGNIRYFVKHFMTDVYVLAFNFWQNKMEQKQPGDDDYSMEYAIRSVLELFHLIPKYADYLTTQILVGGKHIKGDIQGDEMDLTFYNNGFRYYAFENSPSNDMQSKLMMLAFQNTPEKFLLRFCEKAKVVGISATATIPTVIGNYDLDYLHSKMQKLFPYRSEDDDKRLRNAFEESQEGYSDINIKVELLGQNFRKNYKQESWLEIFDTKPKAEQVYNWLEIDLPDSNKMYCKERYLRIAMAFKRFAGNDNIRSFLCILMKHPGTDRELNKERLLKIFDWIMPNGSSHVCFLNGNNFDEGKQTIAARLANGEKLFVISVYATLGAGQNLQYNIPKDLVGKLVPTNNRKPSKQKDFDAIYLDKPTNLLVNMGNNLVDVDFVKYLYQVEYLQESVELSAKTATGCIKKAFNVYTSKRAQAGTDPMYLSDSYKCYLTRAIIQAVGRLCRTNQKNRNIYIFADSQIADVLDYRIDKGRMLNKEFVALLNECRKIASPKDHEINLIDKAELKSVRVNKDILNLCMEGNWNDYKINKWRELRKLALEHPTMSAEEVKECFAASNYYVELPQKNNFLFYRQDGDFNKVEISFGYKAGFAKESSEETRLDRMLSIEGVSAYFEENGFATKFIPNDYIMCPTMWNNIYKGALGEVVGKFLFKKLFDVDLVDIEDKEIFELFDYHVKGKPIFVDFKDWSENTAADRDRMVKKIALKAKKCGCKCAIIANIMTAENHRCRKASHDDLKILAIPALYSGSAKLEINIEAYNMIRDAMGEFDD